MEKYGELSINYPFLAGGLFYPHIIPIKGACCNSVFILTFPDDDQVVNLSLMYSNRAACQLKTGDLSGTVRDCTRSLQLIPHSVKPLLRRAIAYEHLER